MPTIVPKVKSLLNRTTKDIVVRVATILQEIALNRLLTGVSICTYSFFVLFFIEHCVSVINLFTSIKPAKKSIAKI